MGSISWAKILQEKPAQEGWEDSQEVTHQPQFVANVEVYLA